MIVSEYLSNREPIHLAKLVLAGSFFGLSFATHESFAAEFKFQSSLRTVASSIWSTSQERESDNSADQENVLSFHPQMSLSRSGKQVDINTEFGVQHRILTDAGTSSTIPTVNLSALSRVYGDAYTVGAIARSSGRIKNANSSVDGAVEDSDEIPVIFNFEIQQQTGTRIGSRAVLNARHSSAVSHSTLDSDIGSNSHTLEVASNARLTQTGLIGSVRGGYQLTNFDNDTQGSNSMLTSELLVPVTAAVSIYAAAGYEWYSSEEPDLESAGEVGYLGFLWNPANRLSAELGYGRRIYEDSPRAKISYTARRSGVSLSWTRGLQSNRLSDFAEALDATTINAAEIDAAEIDVAAINEQAVSDEEILNFNGLDASSPFLNQQRSINEIVTLELFFNTYRTNYSAVFAYVEQELFEESGVDAVSEIAKFQAIRKIGQSLDIGLEGAYSSEVDESDIRSSRRLISVFSTWQFF